MLPRLISAVGGKCAHRRTANSINSNIQYLFTASHTSGSLQKLPFNHAPTRALGQLALDAKTARKPLAGVLRSNNILPRRNIPPKHRPLEDPIHRLGLISTNRMATLKDPRKTEPAILPHDPTIIGVVRHDLLITRPIERLVSRVASFKTERLTSEPITTIIAITEDHRDGNFVLQRVLEVDFAAAEGVAGADLACSQRGEVERVCAQDNIRAPGPVQGDAKVGEHPGLVEEAVDGKVLAVRAGFNMLCVPRFG